MKIIFNKNDKNNKFTLEDKVDGYTTVNIENRTLFVPKIKTLDIKGRDGALIVDRKYPPREVTVHFLLKANNALEFNEKLKKINAILQKDYYSFGVDNEEGYLHGVVTKIKPPPINRFRGVGSFTFYCDDPFYKKDYIVAFAEDEIKIKADGNISFLYISIGDIKSFKKIKLVNETNGKKIIFNGNYTKIEDKANMVQVFFSWYRYNDENLMKDLDFVESDVEDFIKVSKDDVIKAYVYNENEEEFQQKILGAIDERWI